MGSAEEANRYRGHNADEGGAPPAYELDSSSVPGSAATPGPPMTSGPSTIPAPSITPVPSHVSDSPIPLDQPPYNGSSTDIGPSSSRSEKAELPAGPTVDAPFNFPSDAHPPPYAPSGSSRERPIAIPQTIPKPASPFLPAYPPSLLEYGIPAVTWASFLDTLSAFLTAKVSDRAVSHASDIGRHIGDGPKNAAKGITNHAKSVGKNIEHNFKRGNVVGAAAGVIGGIITVPINTAFTIAGSAISLPFRTASAVAKKPQTPRERAVAYLAVANKDWFIPRGLHAVLLDSQQLSEFVGVSVLSLAYAAKFENDSVEKQLTPLEEHIARLEIRGPTTLSLGPQTQWLVLTKLQPQGV